MATIRRVIEKEMIKFLDQKLAGNGLAQLAIKNKDARTLIVLAAECCVGIQELTGRNDGAKVKLIQETVGGALGEPWCASFVQTCIAYAEVKTGLISPVVATELAQGIWDQTPKNMRVKKLPLPGAIAVWADYRAGKKQMTGHCEIVRAADIDQFQGIGGNTSGTRDPKSKVNREGNGVYFTARSMKSTVSRKLIGFVKPF